MADEKKPDAGGKSGGAGKPVALAPKKSDPTTEIFGVITTMLIVVYLVNGIIGRISSDGFISEAYQSVFPNASTTRPLPLSEEGILLSHTRPIASLLNPIGAQVVTIYGTAVYDSPGGSQVASQPINARGKITEGPVEVNGDEYYFVQFNSGTSGWVRGDDIGYLQSEPTVPEKILIWFYSYVSFFEFLSVLICLCLIVWIVYIVIHLTEVRKKERALLYPDVAAEIQDINPKWRRVLTHVESQNESDWKLAIIEADIMLDEILDKLHLPGETMGEKMKAVEKSDFTTIDNAWEAHKARNAVAHEGGDYVLTQHEARRVVALYQSVFEEFQIL